LSSPGAVQVSWTDVFVTVPVESVTDAGAVVSPAGV